MKKSRPPPWLAPGSPIEGVLGRAEPSRNISPRILIIPEGHSEAAYFNGLIRDVRASSVVIDGVKGVPMTLVNRGIQIRTVCANQSARGDLPDFDQIWCVFDGGDNHPNTNQALHLARQNHLQTAISYPSFDVWTLLHLAEITARPMTNRDVKTYIHNNHLNGFGRSTKIFPYHRLSGQVNEAIARAKKLETEHRTHGLTPNPSSEVYRLVEEIIAAGLKNRLK